MMAPKNHVKPNLQAAISLYYACMANGEKVDLNEWDQALEEQGLNSETFRAYIRMHNKYIKESEAPKEVIEVLTQKVRKECRYLRKTTKDESRNLPDVHCKCGHSWKSRTRLGKEKVRCHKCWRTVKKSKV